MASWRRLAGAGAVAGDAGPPHAAVGQRLGNGVVRAGAGGALDRDHRPPATIGQLQPEVRALAIAGISHHHRPGAAGRGDLLQQAPSSGPGHFIDHLQRQPPLFGVAHLIGDAGPLTAAPGAGRRNRVTELGIVPGLRAEQPPVRRARGVLIHQVHADPDLAVPDLAQSAGILPGHARRRGPVLGEPGVTGHQRLHRLAGREPPRHIPPHCHIIPGRGRDELLQPLMIHAQPLRHRLHRLTPPIGQQAAHIQLPGRPLLAARQPAQHAGRELHQPGPDLRDLLRGHPGTTVRRTA